MKLRQSARQQYKDGNYRDAFAGYRGLLRRPDTDPVLAGDDLDMAISCLTLLNQENEIDDLREEAIQIHAASWRFLWAAARSYQQVRHYGTVVAGQFERGHHRGGGKYANSLARDRVRALQLMVQAMQQKELYADQSDAGVFFLAFAKMWLMDRHQQESSWQLQILTDIQHLPDVEEGYGYRGGTVRGAAADPDGRPIVYPVPASFAAAANDGERWRWCLMMAKKMNPDLAASADWSMAVFLHGQFGVQSMAEYGWWGHRLEDSEDDTSGTYAVHTLSDQEFIARLACGIRRFPLPEEFNFIRIFKSIAAYRNPHQIDALERLAEIYENRRLYRTAAEYWQRILDLANRTEAKAVQAGNQLAQIRDNWGQFEPVMTHPAGRNASVEFRFRNAEKVTFSAFSIKVEELLADVIRYIQKRPRRIDRDRISISDIGWRLVEKNEKQYIGGKAAAWTLSLSPRENHRDRRVTVETPLRKAGAYLLVGTLPGGHTSRIIVWLNDTVIANKPLDERNLYFVADAVTGKPLSHMKLDFLGYRQQYVDRNLYMTYARRFSEYSDKNGMLVTGPDDQVKRYQWLVTARDGQGRLAYLGFRPIWYPRLYDQADDRIRVFIMTDRPVYRPGQTVCFKQWLADAGYGRKDASLLAGRNIIVEIADPKGDRVFEKSYTTDSHGGASDVFSLPGDAALGQYRIYNKTYGYGVSFRVEEYKKPEFEVTVKAPETPAMLGEKIPVAIEAKYYFGEPVARGRIHYKIHRYSHSARWFPAGQWDWLYGPGYWWFAYDTPWYPGWKNWGCPRPAPWWIPVPAGPPEIVAESEAELPEDGTVVLEIDTGLAKEIHGDQDHRYEIVAAVTDLSRRTITGVGSVLAARQPFRVYAWTDRGHYRVGDTIRAEFSARTLDQKPVQGNGKLVLYRVSYDNNGEPIETEMQKWELDTGTGGSATQQITASASGQFRLACTVTDAQGRRREGGHLFTVMGDKPDQKEFRFDAIELIPDRREYAPGEKVHLQVNTNRKNSTVLLFLRPSNGVYRSPEVLQLQGRTLEAAIPVDQTDMPNFFIEALTISDGKLHTTTREIVVPPEKRILNLEVVPSSDTRKPGEVAEFSLRLTDLEGLPFVGSAVVTLYDRALEYISGGSNVPDIRKFFWKWRRHHQQAGISSLDRFFRNRITRKETPMRNIGVFGHMAADMDEAGDSSRIIRQRSGTAPAMALQKTMAMSDGFTEEAAVSAEPVMADKEMAAGTGKGEEGALSNAVTPTIRTRFADSAFWDPNIRTDEQGRATIRITMPDNLTGWKLKSWAMGEGTRVGEAEALVTTRKQLMVRLQAPRFFIETDEVVLSANIHNYLATAKTVQARLELAGGCLSALPGSTGAAGLVQKADILPGKEARIDWRVRVEREGTAVIRMLALTDEESDAVEMAFPVYVHGADTMHAWSGQIKPDESESEIRIEVPNERRLESTRLEIRYSPTLAGAMVDALPYLAEYPYGCTEQTLNRFLPTVITRQVLRHMGLDLAEIQNSQASLNAQELGNSQNRASQWKKHDTTVDQHENTIVKNPVFDNQTVRHMVKTGVQALAGMQLEDGGWGWFSGYGEQSYAHTTAYVVHGLQIAEQNDVALIPGMLDNGIAWLERYEAGQLGLLQEWDRSGKKGKSRADNLDALVYMVLSDGGKSQAAMGQYLYRDRNHLSVYAKAMAGLAFHKNGGNGQRDMLIRNIGQYLVQDPENQTAWLNLGNEGYWWYWYGSEYEAHAYYLKLLAATGDVHDGRASGLVKYLLNNRKHATWWNSTRDTSIVIEAFADYLAATKEHLPDMQVEILVDGDLKKTIPINRDNLFRFDHRFSLAGSAIPGGQHRITVRKKGTGTLYWNAYLQYFSLEDHIPAAGLEVKVDRNVFRLHPIDKAIHVAASGGQAAGQKVEKVERELLSGNAVLKSGDLVEVELTIQSKNDYEYLMVEDYKAAGLEPVDVRSGYTGNDMGAYVTFRDNRVAFFVRRLARGTHNVAYRMRAEIPGKFSALPARIAAMYAPELRGNSREIKLQVTD